VFKSQYVKLRCVHVLANKEPASCYLTKGVIVFLLGEYCVYWFWLLLQSVFLLVADSAHTHTNQLLFTFKTSEFLKTRKTGCQK